MILLTENTAGLITFIGYIRFDSCPKRSYLSDMTSWRVTPSQKRNVGMNMLMGRTPASQVTWRPWLVIWQFAYILRFGLINYPIWNLNRNWCMEYGWNILYFKCMLLGLFLGQAKWAGALWGWSCGIFPPAVFFYKQDPARWFQLAKFTQMWCNEQT